MHLASSHACECEHDSMSGTDHKCTSDNLVVVLALAHVIPRFLLRHLSCMHHARDHRVSETYTLYLYI